MNLINLKSKFLASRRKQMPDNSEVTRPSGSECFRHNPKVFNNCPHSCSWPRLFRGFYFIDDYVSLSDPRSMNGHRQSGGHWNVALGLAVRSSDFLGSLGRWSGSGEGSVNRTLFFITLPAFRIAFI
jgi:hypothetical protein